MKCSAASLTKFCSYRHIVKKEDDIPKDQFPWSNSFNETKHKYVYNSGEPAQYVTHADDEDAAVPERASIDRWDDEARPAWERHSEQGPNLQATGYTVRRDILQEVVNPTDFDYSARTLPHNPHVWARQWDTINDTTSQYEDAKLSKDALNDD